MTFHVYILHSPDHDKYYIGQTGNSFSTRLAEHRAAHRLCHPQKSAVVEHAFNDDHAIDWGSASVIDKETVYFKRLFLEAWHSKRVDAMNRCDLNIPVVYSDL